MDGIEKSKVSVVSRESVAIAGQFVTCVTCAVKRSEKPGLAFDKGSESGSRNKFVSNELDVVDLIKMLSSFVYLQLLIYILIYLFTSLLFTYSYSQCFT